MKWFTLNILILPIFSHDYHIVNYLPKYLLFNGIYEICSI